MKKILISSVILSTILLTGYAVASEAQNNKGSISVSAEATDELSPTSVTLSFAIETRGNSAEVTVEKNKEVSIKALNAVKALIDTAKGETIKTTSYHLNPEYSYKDGQRRLTGYFASNTLQVKLKDTEKAGKVISTALSNGANNVNNVQFSVENTGDNCNLLIQKAAKEARTRADKVAGSLGTSISGIKNISTGCSSNQSYFTNYRLMNAKTAGASDSISAESASLPVEAGKTQIRAYVNADFYVK